MINPEEVFRHALTFYQAGRHGEAEELCRTVLQSQPQHPGANHLLGLMALQGGRPENSLPWLQAAWEADPSEGGHWLSLTECLLMLGRFEDALALMGQAIKQGLDTPEAKQLLQIARRGRDRTPPPEKVAGEVLALYRAGRYAELESRASELLQQYPGWTLGWSALGVAMSSLGKDAEDVMRRAVELSPQSAEVHNNLGVMLRSRGRLDEGLVYLRKAMQLKPKYAEGLYNLGAAMQDADRYEEAIACYRKALKINPAYPDVQAALGIALASSGKIDEGLDVLRRLLKAEPGHVEARGHFLFTLIQSGDADAATVSAEHRRFGEIYETPLLAEWPACPNTRDPDRVLRVGFVSADFFFHAVSSYLEPVIAHMVRSGGMTLHAYYNHTLVDEVTLRLRQYFSHWNMVSGMSDAELADRIHADGIDILIDLSGHTGRNRLLTFARKPAPVQVTWIGYPCTTGLTAMDYYLTDKFFLPPGLYDEQFTEKVVRLPASVPFLPADDAPPVNALPALERGYVTFGSFNRPSKIGRPVVALWSRLLRSLPDSRMLLGAMPKDGSHGELIDWFAAEGVGQERLDFRERTGMHGYLQLHQQVDICLDTFPYNGGTTTFHALWMGVPTLTLVGPTPAGRSGASVLGRIGLEDFIARNEDDFERKGMYWAGNLEALAEMRAGLRTRFEQSASSRPDVIAAGVERALRTMWQRWCSGLPPVAFEVD